MSVEDPSFGPLQIVIVGFETTERLRGEVARELLDLRGRGMIRVLDARLFHRAPDEKLTEVDLGPLLADRPADRGNPVARLLGVNGAGGNGGLRPQEAFARTAGFALEDLRRLTDEIGPGDHAVAILIEHRWAAAAARGGARGGRQVVGQGFLTPEVTMVIGAEIRARPTPRRRSSSPTPHAAGAGRRAFDPGGPPRAGPPRSPHGRRPKWCASWLRRGSCTRPRRTPRSMRSPRPD